MARSRTTNIIKDIEVEVDVNVDDIFDQMDDSELELFGFRRIRRDEDRIFLVFKEFHDTNHGGLISGCTQDPCQELSYDAAELIRET